MGLSSFLPGIYSKEQLEYYLDAPESVELLNPTMVADAILTELLEPSVVSMRDYVKNPEWCAYTHFSALRRIPP